MHAFQACAFNHSAISPLVYLQALNEDLFSRVNCLMLQSDSDRMNGQGSDQAAVWQKTPVANLVRYAATGVYFACLRAGGKLIRRSLKTNKLAVAKLRLTDPEKSERQRVEIQGAAENGDMRFGDALVIFRGRLQNDSSLKPRTKEFREERIASLLKSWSGLERGHTAQIGGRSGSFVWGRGQS
jgi:hypothetical protein